MELQFESVGSSVSYNEFVVFPFMGAQSQSKPLLQDKRFVYVPQKEALAVT